MRFIAVCTREGTATLAEFPDCRGCQTFVRKSDGGTIKEKVSAALHSWLEAQLVAGAALPYPSARVPVPKGATTLAVDVSPALAVKIGLRLSRQRLGLTQADVAQRAGLKQQQIALVESPASNPSIKTLEKVAKALGLCLEVGLSRAPDDGSSPPALAGWRHL
jgi:DNA-binding XRE family transcriptional regulator